MDRYLEELEWRFNNRNNPSIFHDTMERIVNTGTLTYKYVDLQDPSHRHALPVVVAYRVSG